MKRILTGALLLALVLYLVVWAPQTVFLAGVQLFGLLALLEYSELAAGMGQSLNRPAIYMGGVLLIFVSYLRPYLAFYALGFAFLVLFAWELARMKSPAEVPVALALGLTGWVYVSLPFAFLVMLRDQTTEGRRLILLLILALSVGDTAAYYAGRAIGQHKLAPQTSPGKTVEGAIANLIAGVAAGAGLMWLWFPRLPRYHWFLLPLLLNLVGQVGDLAESALKRAAGKKDSSALLPGHGGVLDRVDALLFGAPVLWYYYVLALRDYF